MRWPILLLILIAACTVPADEPIVCCEARTAECLACAQNTSVEEVCEEHPDTPGCPEEPAGQTVERMPYSELFGYDALDAFTYRASVAGETLLVTTTVEEGLSGGEPVYILTTSAREDRNNIMYVDRSTHACVRTHMRIGDERADDVCPVQGLNSRFVDEVVLDPITQERVETLAGTFNASVYEGDGVTYWIAEGVPVPVAYAGEGYAFELVDWE